MWQFNCCERRAADALSTAPFSTDALSTSLGTLGE
jgi:hypothetical protein